MIMPGLKSPEMLRPKKETQRGKDLTMKERTKRANFLIETSEDLSSDFSAEAKAIWDNAVFELESNPDANPEAVLAEASQATDNEVIPAAIKEALVNKLSKAAKLQKKINKYTDMLAVDLTARKTGNADGQLTPESAQLTKEMLVATQEKLHNLRPE